MPIRSPCKMSWSLPRALLTTCVIGLTWGCCGTARAQAQPPAPIRTPTVVPPASELAPSRTAPDDAAMLPQRAAPPRELAKPDDDVRVDVVAYRVDDDAPPELRAALAALTARYTGKQRGFEDLVNAAAEVTRYLQRDLGDYLGYAYLPEQAPQDGIIRIAVLEGRLDRVVLNWPEGLAVDKAVVEGYLAHLQPGAVLKVRDVERVVFLVNDLRGLSARFELRAGSQPGTAELVVTPSAERVWSGKLEADSYGSRPLGLYRLGGLVQLNSPFGRGDGFTANALASSTGGLAFALLGYTTPLGSDGVKVGSSLSAVQYQLNKTQFPLDLKGTAATFNAYGLYPLVRARNLNIFTLASLEHKEYVDRQAAVGGRTRKKVDTYALGATGDFRDSLGGGGVNTYDFSLLGGRITYPDGRNPALTDAPSFTKFTYAYSRLQDWFTGHALVYFSLRGQYAANNLDTTEQFRVGGPDGVRAYASGDGTGDIGSLASLELRLLPPEDWFGRVAREMVFSAFVDGGYVQYSYRTTPGTSLTPTANHATYSGVGLGVAWVRANEYTLRLSVSKAVSTTASSDGLQRQPRIYLQAARLFN